MSKTYDGYISNVEENNRLRNKQLLLVKLSIKFCPVRVAAAAALSTLGQNKQKPYNFLGKEPRTLFTCIASHTMCCPQLSLAHLSLYVATATFTFMRGVFPLSYLQISGESRRRHPCSSTFSFKNDTSQPSLFRWGISRCSRSFISFHMSFISERNYGSDGERPHESIF